MDIIRFYEDYGISYQTEGHKHCRPGWVNIECPFCSGNPGYHLGFSLTENYFHCWRCGKKNTYKVIQSLVNVTLQEARRLFKEYGGVRISKNPSAVKDIVTVRKRAFRFPTGTGPMELIHRKYLKRRGYDPELLEREWNLLGTGPVAFLKDGEVSRDYRLRLIIPIHWKNEVVSFQGRDITGKSKLKYKACPKEREKIHHKTILYGMDKVKGDRIVVVEGVTDVWRLGPGAVATFGVETKTKQLLHLSKFKKVFIMFDNDKAGQKAARKLRSRVEMIGPECTIIIPDTDPGSMSELDAKKMMKELRV